MNRSLSIYLDLIRLAAAVLVVMGHAFHFTHGYFKALAGHGPAAVAVFFVLSGFVIAFVTDAKEKHWRDYTISRSARIYSVAIPAILITILVDQVGTHFDLSMYQSAALPGAEPVNQPYFSSDWGWTDLTRMLTFTNEIWNSHVQVGSGEPYWSLGFEVWYYIIFGCYLFSPFQGWKKFITPALCMAIAGPKVCLYLPLWLFGVVAYRFTKRSADLNSETTSSMLVCWLGLLSTPILYLLARHYIAPHTQSMFLPVKWDAQTWVTVGYFHAIGLFFVWHLVSFYRISQHNKVIQQALEASKRPIQWLAGATFTLYLVHQPLLLACLAANPLPNGSGAWAYTSLGTVFVLVFIIAAFTERQKNGWRRFFAVILGNQRNERTVSAN